MSVRLRSLSRIAAILIIVLTQIGAAPQKEPYVTSWYVRPQRLVDIGARRLNIICTGTGSPTVLLEAGQGADATAWRLLQPAIARQTRMCTYDRASMGFSDPTTTPRGALSIVGDLHALLRGSGSPPPYVLVGWSSGGLYTQLYADRYRKDVASLVQVDADSDYNDVELPKVEPMWPREMRAESKQLEARVTHVRRGTCSFFRGSISAYRTELRAAGCPRVDPADCAVGEVIGEHEARPSYWRDQTLEAQTYDKSEAEVRAAQRRYGDLPLIVVSES